MSCWVVPTIAAELWGVSVEHVLQRVRGGELAHRVDEGFLFVDVIPPAPPKVERPPTFTALSAAEVEALANDEQEQSPVDSHDDEGLQEQYSDGEESQSPDDDEASIELGDWRAARQRVSRTRIAPSRSAKPQAA
ncbi:MAG TPA: hypothetical protein VGR35_03630 [Tepidisphaeraceae bacterium]|nr:hypothetical protein [Tepidisphaeraceae bacterium]